MATPTTPSGVQLCKQGDVELAIGGIQVLAQILDKTGGGIADPNLVAAVIAHASSEALAAIAVQYLPSQLTVPYPDILVYATARLAAFYAWTMGSSEIVSPAAAQALRDDALRVFDRIANRQLSLGVTTTPGTNQDVVMVDRNPNSDQTTQASLAGVVW